MLKYIVSVVSPFSQLISHINYAILYKFEWGTKMAQLVLGPLPHPLGSVFNQTGKILSILYMEVPDMLPAKFQPVLEKQFDFFFYKYRHGGNLESQPF